MIYTSYFGNLRKLPKGIYYSVARYTPYIEGVYHLKKLAPPSIMLSRYKNNTLSKRDYIINFRDILNNTEIPKEFKKNNQDIFLLCYEKEGFCHRHIIAQWLEDNNIKCEEY